MGDVFYAGVSDCGPQPEEGQMHRRIRLSTANGLTLLYATLVDETSTFYLRIFSTSPSRYGILHYDSVSTFVGQDESVFDMVRITLQ